MSISNCILTFDAYADDDKVRVVLVFKLILVYFQHSFASILLFTELLITQTYYFLLFAKLLAFYKAIFYIEENISLKIDKISYNGGYYLMTMLSCDMIISMETCLLPLTKLF